MFLRRAFYCRNLENWKDMGKAKRGLKLSRQDRKHLIDFGEAHPADRESAIRKENRQEAIQTATFKRKIITAKSNRKDEVVEIPSKSKRVKKQEEKEELLEDEETDDSKMALTREDLLNLITETKEECQEAESKLVQDQS